MPGAFEFIEDKPKRQPPPRTSIEAAPARPANDPASLMAQLEALAVPDRRPPATPVQMAAPMKEEPKRAFEPGKRPEPRSGMTAAQLLRDPEILKKLKTELETWEASNPGRKLMGPAVKEMLPQVSDAQARTIAKKIERERVKMAVGPDYMGKAAAKTRG